MSVKAIYLKGMHGMGDNYHQRNFVRQFLAEYDCVYLETSWPSLYWDFVIDGRLKLIYKDSSLRTQAKNAEREHNMFYWGPVLPPNMRDPDKQIWYRAPHIRETGSVLGAMAKCLEKPLGDGDFRIPIKPEWEMQYLKWKGRHIDKPILVYRPLVERTEWSGCNARNPDHNTFRTLYRSIRDKFHVVSVADLEPGKEWIVGDGGVPPADTTYHKGELSVELLTTLVAHASLTFNAPGFMTIMSQAVGTPNVTVFGGYENSQSFSVGAKWAPYLGIDPVNSCQCFMHTHACNKYIDVPDALRRLERFTNEVVVSTERRRAFETTYGTKVVA